MARRRRHPDDEQQPKKHIRNSSSGAATAERTNLMVQTAAVNRSPYRPDQLPGHATTRPLQQSAVLRMQRQAGNAQVQRYLAGQVLQRDPTATASDPAKPASAGSDKKDFDLGEWLHGKIYDALKEQLGEDKLKEHAKQLADKAAGLLLEQVKGATSEADFLQKAQTAQIGKLLTDDLTKAITELFKSPEGQKVRQFILTEAKQDPDVAIGMVLLALGAMIAANAEIPTLKKEFDLGKGFKAGGQADVGRFRELAIKQVQADLTFSSKYFRAGVHGGYKGEGKDAGFSGKAEASVGSNEFKFNTSAAINPGGNFKLDFGPALKFDNFQTSLGAGWDSAKGWNGLAKVQFGDKTNHLVTQLQLGSDGNASLAHSLNLKNPLSVQGLNIEASLHHTLTDPKITAAALSGQYNLLGTDQIKAGHFIFLKVEGKYQPPEEGSKQQNLTGYILLGGRF